MYPYKKYIQPKGPLFCFTVRLFKFLPVKTLLLVMVISWVLIPSEAVFSQGPENKSLQLPIAQDDLISSLSKSRGSNKTEISYPHKISYTHVTYDMANDMLKKEPRELIIERRPEKIIPQSVGISEILWAICPHDRILAYHEASTKPNFSFIADMIPSSKAIFGTEDAETVIGLDTDLVLITYYTSPEFRERLNSAKVNCIETGYFGDIASIKKQIMFIGRIIGEKANASKLIEKMEISLASIKTFVNQQSAGKDLKVIYYDEGGYVAGKNTNFDSICQVLGVKNSASEHNIKYYKQITYEQILKWDPDIIIISDGSSLASKLYSEPVLQTAKAIKNKKIKKIPSVYLNASSQYIVASINYIAGLLYAK